MLNTQDVLILARAASYASTIATLLKNSYDPDSVKSVYAQSAQAESHLALDNPSDQEPLYLHRSSRLLCTRHVTGSQRPFSGNLPVSTSTAGASCMLQYSLQSLENIEGSQSGNTTGYPRPGPLQCYI